MWSSTPTGCVPGHQASLVKTQTKRKPPDPQSRGKSKRVKTLLVVLIRGGSKEGEEIRNLPPSLAHLYLLSVRTESKAPGRVRRLQGLENYHWVAEGLCNLRPIQNPGVPAMALRDGSMRSSTPTDSEVRPLRTLRFGPYGACAWRVPLRVGAIYGTVGDICDKNAQRAGVVCYDVRAKLSGCAAPCAGAG